MKAELDSFNVRTRRWKRTWRRCPVATSRRSVMSRAFLREPAMLIADEPTQGVDVGTPGGDLPHHSRGRRPWHPVIVASSDAHELEGLCDRVIVMSRGQSVVELTGDDVTEERIVRAAVSATTHQDYQDGPVSKVRSSAWGRFCQGDDAPVLDPCPRHRRGSGRTSTRRTTDTSMPSTSHPS